MLNKNKRRKDVLMNIISRNFGAVQETMSNIDIADCEILANVVRNYPSVYDKSRQEYRDILVKANDWKAIAEEIEFLEDATDAQNKWRNLSKLYSKKRNALKSAQKSGTSTQRRRRPAKIMTNFHSWHGRANLEGLPQMEQRVIYPL